MKKILLSIFLFSALVLPVVVLAQHGLDETAKAAGLGTDKTITTIIGNVLGTALSLISVVFFGLMIAGGVMWMIAHGNETLEEKGLATIRAAIIGLIIILASYAITQFVFNSVGAPSAVTGGGPTGDVEQDTGPIKGVCTDFNSPTGNITIPGNVEFGGNQTPTPAFACVDQAAKGVTCLGEPIKGYCAKTPPSTMCCQPKTEVSGSCVVNSNLNNTTVDDFCNTMGVSKCTTPYIANFCQINVNVCQVKDGGPSMQNVCDSAKTISDCTQSQLGSYCQWQTTN